MASCRLNRPLDRMQRGGWGSCLLAGLLVTAGLVSPVWGQSSPNSAEPSAFAALPDYGRLERSINAVLRRSKSGTAGRIHAALPSVPEVMAHSGDFAGVDTRPPAHQASVAWLTQPRDEAGPGFPNSPVDLPAGPRPAAAGTPWGPGVNSPTRVAGLARHPLAFQSPRPQPAEQAFESRLPALNAPYRAAPEISEPMFSDGPELVLPSGLRMSESGQGEAWEREQFWKQFAGTPTGCPGTHHTDNQSLAAILNNGFWFAGLDILFVEPIFQSNNVIVDFDSASGVTGAVPASYAFSPAWKGHFGFESSAGPGIKLAWLNLNQFSAPASFVATGTASAISQVDYGTAGNSVVLATTSAGDRLQSQQQIKLNSVDVLLYKDHKNPISRVRGNMGLGYVSLKHLLFTDLYSAGGVTSLRNVNDWEGLGPKIGIEYFRPIGHTRLEFQSGLFGSLLFGRRDQVVTEVGRLQFTQIGKTEPLGILDLYLGVQRNFRLSRCRSAFLRTTLDSQYWSNGDSAVETGSDFGFYGFTVAIGITR